MPEHDALATIAEVAVGLAGFSGLALALVPSPSPYYRFRAISLVGTAIVLITLALLPVALLDAGWRPQSIWRAGSGVLASFSLVYLVFGVSYRRLADPTELMAGVALSLGGLVLVNGVVQVLNAIGLIWIGSFSIFYVGLVVGLIYCGVMFIVLVAVRP